VGMVPITILRNIFPDKSNSYIFIWPVLMYYCIYIMSTKLEKVDCTCLGHHRFTTRGSRATCAIDMHEPLLVEKLIHNPHICYLI
jgi:hypothetical protein